MKIIKAFFTYIVPLIVGLFIGLSLFFPWQDVFELVFLRSSSIAAKNGVEVQAESFEKKGLLPSFIVEGMSVKYFMGGAKLKKIRIVPQVLSSVVKKRIVVKLDIDSGKLELPAMVDKKLSGSLLVLWKPGALEVNRIKLDGDISAAGDVSVNLKNKKILMADVNIKVPADMSAPMNTLRKMLPLKRNPDGSWLLSRKGHKK